MDPIRVLIVDDSPFMRKALERMLQAPDIQVVGAARDGLDALEKIPQLNPDIVTLDVEMPRLDGLGALKRIMAEMPRAVLMVSSLTQEGAAATLEALAFGALDFIPKESSLASNSILQIQQDLQEKVRKLARSPKFKSIRPAAPAAPAPRPGLPAPPAPAPHIGRVGTLSGPTAELLAIGCSTGGPKALQDLLPALPRTLPVPCLVVQHMPGTFTRPFAERLNGLCQVEVKEAEHGETARPGVVYIAPGGQHMLYRQRGLAGVIELSMEPSASLHRPSVDVLFQSLAENCSRQVLAMILTGMGSDGARGMVSLKARGAHTLAEAEESCVVYGMPRAAFEKGCVDQVAPLQDMAGILRKHFGV
ncbi:protein-glutamate methylesterase/protein-glutamine glutaminase [Mesoterricola sediminis]|uniref:Protein-glutamate methylesterase/protein-glutamine glutaminase n=1 Tax=Mesoterricola sediminis TaxID=2927980 RepID=A0AA48GY91_9BACT|nr:chemotaxis response regulator protein-glutamate methylesterase [Mesoterricola sediminis]BDU77830.1 chemotaxis response regulator protein-glutamate methylesterase [Mesoterricola sediminis]